MTTAPMWDGDGVQLVVGPDDEAAFAAASDALLDRVAECHDADVVANAGLALDWKWRYGDGHLARWRRSDLAELLVEWCPRKLTAPPEDRPGVPLGVAVLLEVLDADGLLDPAGAPLASLLAAIEDLTPAYLAAMADPAAYGLAKSLFSAAAAEGVDLSDPASLERFMAEFNDRPEDERRRLIPVGAHPAGLGRPSLPPVVLPDDAAVDASAVAAPILPLFERLAGFVGAGRKLTATGNLTLADARALVELLETGDIPDQVIGDTTYKLRSAAELPRLRLIFAWAKKAGVLRVAHGKVIATKAGLGLERNRRAGFDRALSALLELGPLAAQRDDDGWFAWPAVTAFLDECVAALLVGPYVAQRPVPVADLAATATAAVLRVFEFRLDDVHVERRIGWDVEAMVDALELAGVARRADTTTSEHRRREGGSVELTPAGVVTAHRLAGDAGYEVPTAGRFADRSAAELLTLTDHLDLPELWGELEAWRRARSPAAVVGEMAAAVTELADPALRQLALAVLDDVGVEHSEAAVRGLLTHPHLRGAARCWLVDHGLDERATLLDPDDLPAFVDVLAHHLVADGPRQAAEDLALAGGHGDQITLLGRLAKVSSPATEVVLGALGRHHPVKLVAKAARKELLRHRSWLANQ